MLFLYLPVWLATLQVRICWAVKFAHPDDSLGQGKASASCVQKVQFQFTDICLRRVTDNIDIRILQMDINPCHFKRNAMEPLFLHRCTEYCQ